MLEFRQCYSKLQVDCRYFCWHPIRQLKIKTNWKRKPKNRCTFKEIYYIITMREISVVWLVIFVETHTNEACVLHMNKTGICSVRNDFISICTKRCYFQYIVKRGIVHISPVTMNSGTDHHVRFVPVTKHNLVKLRCYYLPFISGIIPPRLWMGCFCQIHP